MRKINLISEIEFYQDKHFYVMDYYGKEIVMFHTTENEAVHRSLHLLAYSNDFKPLPAFDMPPNDKPYSKVRDFVLGGDGTEFFMVADKGTIGFDSVIFISRCNIEESSDDEFIVKITIETDETVKEKVIEAYKRDTTSTSIFFQSNFSSNILQKFKHIPVAELAKKAEETPFLDIDEDDYALQLSITVSYGYFLEHNTKGYKQIDSRKPIEVGSLLFTCTNMQNCVEISEIKQIAHTIYGAFYAIIEPAYIYPKDNEVIQQKFPDFYKAYCLNNTDMKVKESIGIPDTIPFIPENCEIGEPVIYQEIFTACGGLAVNKDVFQFIADSTYILDYDSPSESFIHLTKNMTVGTVISVNGFYSILTYQFKNVVRCKDKNYAKFKYISSGSSKLFSDFSEVESLYNAPCKYYRLAEFLLYREKIAPVIISKEKYDSLISNH